MALVDQQIAFRIVPRLNPIFGIVGDKGAARPTVDCLSLEIAGGVRQRVISADRQLRPN